MVLTSLVRQLAVGRGLDHLQQQSIRLVAVLAWIQLQQRLGQVDQEIRPHLDSGAELIFLRDLIDRAHEADGDRRVLERVWQLQENPGA